MFERPEPQFIRVRTFVLLLLACATIGGAAAEVTNVVRAHARQTVEASR